MDCTLSSPWSLIEIFSNDTSDLLAKETYDIIIDMRRTSLCASPKDDIVRMVKLLRPGGYYFLHSNAELSDVSFDDTLDVTITRIAVGVIFQNNARVDLRNARSLRDVDPTMCVTTATFERDASSSTDLERMWKMLVSQSYKKWILYLTGDCYQNSTEWSSLSFFNNSQARLHNLARPGERLEFVGQELWRVAGRKAIHNALDRAVIDGCEWVVHLDDDDHWDVDHLTNIHTGIKTGATFVFTQAQFGMNYLPEKAMWATNLSHTVLPQPCQVVHSSVAYNVEKLHIRYDVSDLPCDAFLWARITFSSNFFPAYIPIPSAHYIKHEPLIVRMCLICNFSLPAGWYGGRQDDDLLEYSTLVTNSFPNQISDYCHFIVGPLKTSATFQRVAVNNIPYHIRSVERFNDLPVWRRLLS